MKIKTICVAVICLSVLFGNCNKEDTFQDNLETAEKLLTVLVVQNGAAEIYADTLAATQDSIAAVNAMGQWLLDQPDVQEAYICGSDLVEVRFKNGMKSNLVVVTHDAEGQAQLWTSSYGEITTNNDPIIVRYFYAIETGVTAGSLAFIDGDPDSGYFSCQCVKD